MKAMNLTFPSLQNLPPRMQLTSSIAFAVLVFSLLPTSLHPSTRLLATWVAGVSCLLLLLILMMKQATADKTRDRAARQRTSSTLMVVLVGLVGCVSAVAFGLLLSTAKSSPATVITLHLGLSIVAILCSWFLLHITFAQHYAALYYRRNGTLSPTGGLQFVEQENPTYWDFLYFAFILGATAQTADTFISSRPMRRLALGHCLISFWFFVGIIAMTVNLAGELLQTGSN